MSAIKAVCRALERIAPLRLAEKWDNVGLLLESPITKPEANKVLLTIDLTPAVLQESLDVGASVIVSYHPPIFGGLKSITLSNPLQKSLLTCAASGISIFSPHTTLDSVWGGVNDWLAEGVLGRKAKENEVKALVGEKLDPEGKTEGAEGRLVTLEEPISMEKLESRILGHLGISQLQVGYGTISGARPPESIRTVAVCAGSGGSMLVGKNADVYFTGEMSHHEVLAAVAAGKHVILCGHTNTERGYLPVLASKLGDVLVQDQSIEHPLEVVVSKKDKHPLVFSGR